jgi:selenocysteine lyase/cysteine desulfurase
VLLDDPKIRADTPACEERIFLDSAGSSLAPQPVLRATIDHLRREAEVGGYVAAAERADDLAGLKTSLGHLLNCSPQALALTDSATRSWTQFVSAVTLRRGDRILITEAEYASNAVALLQRARRCGAHVEVVPSDHTGELDLGALEATIDERVRLVSLVHVPTNGGLVNPVAEVVDVAHRRGALVLLDACQSVGQLGVDVTRLGVDALSATGRKWLRGPRGTGVLYVRPELIAELEPPGVDLHSATWTAPGEYELRAGAERFELWETDVAGRLGLKAAVDYLLALGPAEVERAVAERAQRLRAALASIPGVTVRDRGRQPCGIVSFTVDGVDAASVCDQLAAQDVIVTVSRRPSTLLDMTARGLESVVRASPHYFVSERQIDAAAAAVARLAASRRVPPPVS